MARYITTFTGIQFHLDRPTREMITLDDIAHHLSMICHWNGACRKFFSVAQHSLLVSKIVPPELAKWGLMHDAAEAYIGDVSRPLKYMISEENKDSAANYKNLEMHILRLVADEFGLEWPMPVELKTYDNQILELERSFLMHATTRLSDSNGDGAVYDIRGVEEKIPSVYIVPMLPEIAELSFLSRFRKLFHDEDGL